MEIRKNYYDIVCKISSLTGLWPYLKPRARIFRVGLLTVTMLTIFIPQIAYQFTCKTNLQCIFEAMTSYLLTVVAFVKVYTFQFNTHKIKGLTQHLFVDWKRLETPKEYEIMKLYAKNSRRFCMVYAVYYTVATFTFMSMTFIPFVFDVVWPLNESRPVLPPYPGYYFVDNREYFFKIYCHSLISWEIIMVGIVAHDCMFVTYVEHVCSKFALVGFHFENLFCNCDEEIKITDNSDDTYRKRIKLFVHEHWEALKFAETLEDTFVVPFAVQILIVTVGISVTLLQITQQEGEVLESIRYVVYVIGQLIHLFFLSFEGQKLIDHSLQTGDKICNSAWYEVSVRSQRLIMLVMMKSTRPSFLSAGKIYVFSLESFTTVMRAELLRNCYRASRMRDTTFLFSRFYKLRCRTLLFSHPFSNPNCLCIKRNHYYNITKRMLSLDGLWPYQSRGTRSFRVSIFTVITISMIIPQVIQIIRYDGNARIFLIIPAVLLIVTIQAKLYTCQFNTSKIKNLIDHLRDNWEKLEDAEEYEIIKTYVARAKLLSLIYFLYVYVSTSLFMLITISSQILNIMLHLNETRPLMMPFDAYYFVDTEQYYFYIIFHIWVSIIIILTGAAAHDCMYLIYIEHVCSLFTLAGFCLKTVSRNDRNNVSNNSKNGDKIYNQKTAISIHIHWRAIWFTNYFEDFCISFIVISTIITIAISIILLQFEEVLQKVKSIAFIIGQLMHSFYYSMQSQKLMNHSIQLREEIYNSSWYKILVKSQKLFLYMMQRSLEPNFLSAGRIFVFSLKSFTTLAQIFRCNGNGRCIFLIIPAVLLMITILVKLYTCQFNNSKIKNLTDHLGEDWEQLEGVEEYEIMKTYAARARLLSLIYSLYLYVSLSLFMLITISPQILNVVLPVINESRPLMMPFDAYYFVNTEQYYFYIIFHIWVGVIIILVGALAHDCLFFTYVEHVCSLFALAGYLNVRRFRLKTVSRNICNDAANGKNGDKIYNRKIAISIHIHWRAIWFAEHLEETFSISFVVQMMIVVVVMSITLLQIALQFEDVLETIKSISFIVGQLMHLFCYSMQGQKLMDHSIQLREEIYNSFWYEIPVKSQRLLLYVMQRSLEPNFLSAGKIFVFSLKSFTTVRIIHIYDTITMIFFDVLFLWIFLF
ncbi:uncharacterized protein LOC105199461 [Solenopsis invicta]|uniref:uncharacterized protein LOC105199461 n=1 Tax=Solenopsis invicta TaxID=13686 RepID=UPI00193E9393|nr:uncharacterized protein LOC105199461 [Solenopsis invicta]